MPRRRTGQEREIGRPGSADATLLIRAPSELLEAVRKAAEAERISASEWWRRAARERLDATIRRRPQSKSPDSE